MTDYPRGQSAEFRVTFLDTPTGIPTDPTNVSVRIYRDDDVIVGPETYPGNVQREIRGLYAYTWQIPGDAEIRGDYTVRWQGTIGGTVRTGYELFAVVEGGAVVPGQPAAWATTVEVESITGHAVTAADLRVAQSTIEVFVGRTYADTARCNARDRGWLRTAVAHQAAWMLGQPDYHLRMDLLAIPAAQSTSSGQAVTPTAMALAPMAKWSIRRISWLRSRSLRVKSSFTDSRARSGVLTALSEARDEDQSWRSMS